AATLAAPAAPATPAGPAAAPTPPEALLFRPGRGATVDHVDGTTVLYWRADDPEGQAWADRTVRGLEHGPAALLTPGAPPASGTDPGPDIGPATGPAPVFTLRDSREQYLASIRAAQEEIVEGN